ncbi:lipopolysaccharide heptosyltransferase RfaC [Pantoea sp. Mhis]|uniref:lipopolysaccharide heptosyltransferase RfaC n=1 Tax=Pantoea sp. Mhis TaxID=2576759 RepID=UPI0013593EAB|nr:lipopolysaccharide heptosyltransferase RfaC [Pantoea sp. Mhis]MXP56651.1 lipopolysaccharide heptosyltransferase RfaC [Pantoea sp. Mhis]
MKVLIVKTSSMGDILHTLPAVTDAMNILPKICFHWVVEEDFLQIPAWHPAVARVIPVAIRRWRKHWFGRQQSKERRQFKTELQLNKYDLIIDAQGLIKSAVLITRLAQGKKHGYNCQSARESFAGWWYDKGHRINKDQHAIERTRELFSKCLDYKKPKNLGNYAIAEHFSSSLTNNTYEYLIFIHSTTDTNKHWPELYWRKLIQYIQSNILKIKLPWGLKHEYLRACRLAKGFKYVEVLPKLTLEQIAMQLIGARAVVSVDTGLSHLTAALGRPNITLYGPTYSQLIGSYGKNQISLTSSTQHLSDLKVEYVLPYLQSILDKNIL